MNRSRLLVAVVMSFLLLAGCGEEGKTTTGTGASPEPTTSSSPAEKPAALPDLPACAKVWKGGRALPRPYKGCLKDEKVVKAGGMYCSFGKPLFTYANRYYGVPGGRIHDTKGPLKKDRGYRRDMASCMG